MFVNKDVGGSIPKEYIAPIDEGIQDAMNNGILGGYQMLDIKVTLVDGSYHDVDSSEMAFKIAGSMAFKDGCRRADPVLLEPIMKVDVVVPEEYMGDVIGDLNSRRGRIDGMNQDQSSGLFLHMYRYLKCLVIPLYFDRRLKAEVFFQCNLVITKKCQGIYKKR